MKNYLPAFLFLIISAFAATAQPVTGVWRGKVTKGKGLLAANYRLELKLIKTGDSLVGNSYYYANASNYYRYAVKGYFDPRDNSVIWWDDQLLESKSAGLKVGGLNSIPLMAEADFNCPGSGIMKLDGNAKAKTGDGEYELHLDKYDHPQFRDPFDAIIVDYFFGGADARLIDSVYALVTTPKPAPVATPPVRDAAVAAVPEQVPVKKPAAQPKPAAPEPAPPVVVKPAEPAPAPVVVTPAPPVVTAPPKPVLPPTVEDKFVTRKNVFATEIPIAGDSILLNFYDNAEVDGDSIALFLNNKLLLKHIRLTDKPYPVKLAVADLLDSNDLVMVAENLGSIPPNTSYMEAWSGGQRYTARIESTEKTSAIIRLRKI